MEPASVICRRPTAWGRYAMTQQKHKKTSTSPGGSSPNSSGESKVVISHDKFDAVLFDMDGVVTKTAIVHTAAWKKTFDAFLERRDGANFKPFSQDDYLQYVDGKPREDGIRSFLSSRDIKLPEGASDDQPGYDTISALGKLKNQEFLQELHSDGVEPYETTVALILALKAQQFKVAVITASKNGAEILRAANLAHVFDVQVDGVVAQKMGLPGKPDPDTFLEAARQLGVKPSRAIVVEDAAAGVQAGHRGDFGLVIGVARHNNFDMLKKHGADVVVADLGEVQVFGDESQIHPGMALADLNVTDKNWAVVYDHFAPEEEGMRESLCALGNGYFCTRGAAPESHDDGVHYPGTYLAGAYNLLLTRLEGHLLEEEQLVNLPNWLSLTFSIEGGDWFDLRNVQIDEYKQVLDIRDGVLKRKVRFTDSNGRQTTVAQRWFLHMQRYHLAALESSWIAHNWSGTLKIRSAIDGTVINNGVPIDPRIKPRHLKPLFSDASGDTMHLKMITTHSHLVIAMSAKHLLLGGDGRVLLANSNDIIKDDFVAQEFQVEIAEQEQVVLQKKLALYYSKDRAISEPGEAASQAIEEAPDFATLLDEQDRSWHSLWRQFDLFVETNESQPSAPASLLLHLNGMHALQAASPNITGLDAGLPARGWTGEGYEGHVFWDDLFAFPFLNLRMPQIAESLLKYRYRRLDQARKIARSLGAKGARYPWQSGCDGSEETPQKRWVPEKQQWVNDYSLLEIHVNAAIAYNIWQYYQVTADLDFMIGCGAEMILEISRFFATFAKYNRRRDRYEIHGVVGPDEFHVAYPNANKPGINNNAYTNVMAAWTLARALQLLDLLPADHKSELCRKLNITQDEISLWDSVSRKLYVGFMENGVISQFEGYDKLEDFPWITNGKIDTAKLTEVLTQTNGNPNQYKLCKQADVLMLFYVFSADELKDVFNRLGYLFRSSDIKRNIDYYLPKTANLSSLSRVAHAWVLSRMDRAASWNLLAKAMPAGQRSTMKQQPEEPSSWTVFLEALGNDYFDIHHGATRSGIHMGAIAGTLDIVQRCYTGIVTRDDVLWFSPKLPSCIQRLTFCMHYRGQSLQVEITQSTLRIQTRHSSATPIKIGFKQKVFEMNSGESMVFHLAKAVPKAA